MIIYTRKRSHKRRKNASRKHRRSKARRHNPGRSHKRRHHRAHARRRNPARSHRRSHTRRRRNPSMGSVVNKGFLVNAVLGALGFVGGLKASSMIAGLPFMSTFGRFSGAINLLVGMFVYTKAKNANVKAVAVGLGASGAYDLLAKNVTALSLPSLQGVDVMGQHGIDVLPQSGEDEDMSGVDVMGVDVMGAQPNVMLGEDSDGFDGEDDEMMGDDLAYIHGNDYSGRF